MSFASCEVGESTEAELSRCSKSDGSASLTGGSGGGDSGRMVGEGGLPDSTGAIGGLQ